MKHERQNQVNMIMNYRNTFVCWISRQRLTYVGVFSVSLISTTISSNVFFSSSQYWEQNSWQIGNKQSWKCYFLDTDLMNLLWFGETHLVILNAIREHEHTFNLFLVEHVQEVSNGVSHRSLRNYQATWAPVSLEEGRWNTSEHAPECSLNKECRTAFKPFKLCA